MPPAVSDLGLLAKSISGVPIPTTQPSWQRGDQEFGLHLLAAATRLEHIRRITETLTLADSTHMSRRVALDVDLDSLPTATRQALRAEHAGRTDSPLASTWIPLERSSRATLTAVVVRDASGTVLPLLTGRETSRAISAGLAFLFNLLLASHPEASEYGSSGYNAMHDQVRSNWLTLEAIRAVIENGTRLPMKGFVGDRPSNDYSKPSEIRRLASSIAELIAPKGSPFDLLLSMAASEYIVVAQIPAAVGLTHVEYQSPLIPARARTRLGFVFATAWLPIVSSEFSLVYETEIPSGVNSYHVSLEVPQEIEIRRMTLTSDADRIEVERLRGDLIGIAESLDSRGTQPSKVHELELQSISSRLADLVDQRMIELQAFHTYIRSRFERLQGPAPWLPSMPGTKRATGPTSSADPFVDLATNRSLLSALKRFRSLYHEGELINLAKNASPHYIRMVADRLGKDELDVSTTVDNDPRENAGHAQWRRRRQFIAAGSEPTRVRLAVTMADDSPSLSASVARLLFGLTSLVLSLLLLLAGSEKFPFGLGYLFPQVAPPVLPNADGGIISSADAIVTILLLIPGLLVTRLDFPSHRTVLGRLRLLARYQAYAGVIVTCALGIAVATRPHDEIPVWLMGGAYALLALFVASLLDGVIRAWGRRIFTPRLRDIPRWLRMATGRIPRYARRNVTARFSTLYRGHRNA